MLVLIMQNLCSTYAEETSVVPVLERMVVKLFGARWQELGWGPVVGSAEAARQKHLDSLERAMLLQILGLHSGSHAVELQAESWRRLQAAVASTSASRDVTSGSTTSAVASIHPDLRGPVYVLSIKHAGQPARQLLQQLYQQSVSNEERVRLLTAMGTTRGAAQDDTAGEVRALLDWVLLSGEVRNGDLLFAFSTIGQDSALSRELCWAYMQSHWEALLAKFRGAMFVLGRIFPAVLGEMTSEQQCCQFEAFFAAHPAQGAERSVKQSAETVRARVQRLQREAPVMRQWAAQHASV
jgi:hypothetical protein